MPSNFGLTMAPETAYVTGGSVVYGSIWGSYLPIVKTYVDNGRPWWLNMQYYNGSMYGRSADSHSAGTVQGFTAQTDCVNYPGLRFPGLLLVTITGGDGYGCVQPSRGECEGRGR